MSTFWTVSQAFEGARIASRAPGTQNRDTTDLLACAPVRNQLQTCYAPLKALSFKHFISLLRTPLQTCRTVCVNARSSSGPRVSAEHLARLRAFINLSTRLQTYLIYFVDLLLLQGQLPSLSGPRVPAEHLVAQRIALGDWRGLLEEPAHRASRR